MKNKLHVNFDLSIGICDLLLRSAKAKFHRFSEGKFEDTEEMKCYLGKVKEYLKNNGHFELAIFISLVNVELDNYLLAT